VDIKTTPRIEKLPNGGAYLYVDVQVDGVHCSSVLVCGSSRRRHTADLNSLLLGEITLPELQQRWSLRQ